MRAISIQETGPPEVMQLRDVEAPTAGEGEALVRVVAAGVNYADVVMRSGRIPSPLPMIPGVEGAGVVEAVGAGVEDVAVGDRVAWAPVMGAGAVVRNLSIYAAAALLLSSGWLNHATAAATLPSTSGIYLLFNLPIA